MASRTAQSAVKTAKRQNEFGADLWVKDQSKTYRHPTGGRGMFAGLQDAKHYNVEGGWAKRAPDERPGFFSWLYNRILTTEIEGSSWRQMRAWATMTMATAAAAREESKMNLQPPHTRPILEPVRVPISTTQSPSPMAALAMRMRQNAQRRTMTTMAYPYPYPSSFPFLAPLSSQTTARRRHRAYPRPRRLPARAAMPPSSTTRLKLPVPQVLTKTFPLTVVSLALAAATASWVVSIVLHPISHFHLSSSSSTSASSPLADPTSPRRPTTAIPPPHQIYDEAMYKDPAFSALMVQESGRGRRHMSLGPVACFFLPSAGEEQHVLRERYDYSFWVDGMDS